MVKEYIAELKAQNEVNINLLSNEVRKTSDDLSCTQQLIRSLESEKQSDAAIFSPRTVDLSADDKLQDARQEASQLQQKIDNLNRQTEEALKKREEFALLEKELDEQADGPADNAAAIQDIPSDNSFSELLQTLQKKLETSLSLLNGNKNRCRAELRSALNLIQQYKGKAE